MLHGRSHVNWWKRCRSQNLGRANLFQNRPSGVKRVALTKKEDEATPRYLKVVEGLSHYAKTSLHSCWAYGIVSRWLSWAWLPGRPIKRVRKGQPSTPLIEQYVLEMLEKGSIELVPQSHLFLVPKKDSIERRMVLNLSVLNWFILSPTFKMITVKTIHQVPNQGSLVVTLDLKDVHWHVPIRESFWNFLAFQVECWAFHFWAMLFGLNITPRIFTKLRTKGIKIFDYLDDWIIWESSPHRCRAGLLKVRSVTADMASSQREEVDVGSILKESVD